MTEAYDLAMKQWQDFAGVQALLQHWQKSTAKAEAEELVGGLVAGLEKHNTIVDLGCGNGRLISHLPRFYRYYGYDTSTWLLAEARKQFGEDGRVAFALRDIRDGAAYKGAKDVVLCVHVARHYVDPVGLLRDVLAGWSGRAYVFSVLHGPEEQELLNGRCLATADLDGLLGSLGPIGEAVDQATPDGLFVRYFTVLEDG